MEGGFWANPKEVTADKKLSSTAKLVYSVLYTRMNGDQMAWPSQEYIALAIGSSVRQVVRSIKELEKRRYLVKKRQGLRKSNQYFLKCQNVTSRSAKMSLPSEVTKCHTKRREDIEIKRRDKTWGSEYGFEASV